MNRWCRAYPAREKTFCVSVIANQETLREVCKYLQSAQRKFLMAVSKKVNENLGVLFTQGLRSQIRIVIK